MSKTENKLKDGNGSDASTCYALIGDYQEHGYDSEKEFNGIYSTREKAEFQGGLMMDRYCYVYYDIIECKIDEFLA